LKKMKTIKIVLNCILLSGVILTTASCHNHSAGHSHADESMAESHDHAADHDHIADTHAAAHPGEVHFTKAQARACGLALETVKAGEFYQVIRTSGRLEALSGAQKTVVAPSNGTVALAGRGIYEGMEVKKGDVLYYVSAKTLAEGDQMAKAKAEFEAARQQYERAQALVADRIISEQEFEQARTRYEIAKASFEGQSGSYSEKGAAVTAPSDGYVAEVMKSAGEYVSTGDAVLVLGDNSRMALCADVPEADYRFLKQIQSANFKTVYDDTLYSTAELNGRVASFSKATQGAYIQIVFEFDNRAQLVPGSYAQVYLEGKAQSGVISVPVSALIEEQGIMSVFVQEDEEIFRKQEVRIGRSDGRRTEVLSGLNEGDRVVVSGAYNVKLATASSAIPGHTHNH
jgi:membrane fusion protein, heavy metal efflux system